MKKIFLILILTLVSFSLFAIPGVNDIIPTESGQFVYYRDYSFTAETYIGFLQYDSGSYAIRYFSPNPNLGSSEIELLITIDANQDYVLMTGEKIVSNVTMDDNTTINYLHDLFYEFSSRRKRVNFPVGSSNNIEGLPTLINSLQNSKVEKTEDFFQYGGNVLMEYDFSIPIFNLRSIISGQTILLEAVTMGQLTHNEDTSFTDFKGFSELPSNAINTSLIQGNLESLWVENQPNFWFIDDDALLYSYDIEMTPSFFEGQNYTVFDFLSKKLSLSVSTSYVYLPEQSVTKEGNTLILSNVIYLPQSNTFTKDTKIITPPVGSTENASLYGLTAISAFYEFYYANEEYFKDKIDSFIQ